MRTFVGFPQAAKTLEGLKPKRILFASVPANGHFNPLTGIAIDLLQRGYEVAWYASLLYAEKLKKPCIVLPLVETSKVLAHGVQVRINKQAA